MKLIAVLLAMVITSFTGFSGLHAQERGKEKGRGGTVKKIEAKGKELTPYWKGKEANKDSASMAKVETLINKKDFGGAIEELKSFKQLYPDSPLKPIAILSLAYCYAQAGKADEAKQAFEGFLRDYPDHELTADARAGLELLKGENK